MLLKALPFNSALQAFLERYPRVYVVEQNRDGQVADLVRLECPSLAARVRSVRHFTGLPIDARFVTDAILAQEGAASAGVDGGAGGSRTGARPRQAAEAERVTR
jgi:hypothetical protein